MTAEEPYEAMDWLLRRRERIERTLAAKHVEDGSLVLCDLTSVYFEGARCPLAKRGHSRDGRRGKLQIVFALLRDRIPTIPITRSDEPITDSGGFRSPWEIRGP